MITLYTILALAAIGIQAFFTSTEMAFTSANKLELKRLADEGDRHARKLLDFMGKEGMFLATTLVGTNICVITSSTLATRVFIEYFGTALAPVFAIGVMVPITLLIGDITPKMLARHLGTPYALRAITPLSAFFRVFKSLIIAVNGAARIILTPLGSHKKTWDFTFTKSDLKRLLLMGHETGEVNADEVELIHRVLDFSSISVEKIMIPLYRVSAVPVNATVEDLRNVVVHTGFSRIPVYEGAKDNIAGIVNIYDILFSDADGSDLPLRDFVRETVYIDKDDPLDIVLTRLRNQKQPMGIVADPSRKALGVVTIEDILEELVGEIEDKGDRS